MQRKHEIALGLLIAAVLLALLASGCMYHVPLSERLSEAKHKQAVLYELEARENGWDGVWDARIHSLHT